MHLHNSPSITAALAAMIYMHVHNLVHVQRENEIAAAAKPVPPKTVTFTAGGHSGPIGPVASKGN